jgi:hypothetical protein
MDQFEKKNVAKKLKKKKEENIMWIHNESSQKTQCFSKPLQFFFIVKAKA